jgi:translation initiation factor 3 subunit E
MPAASASTVAAATTTTTTTTTTAAAATSTTALPDPKYDLTNKLAPFMDLHFMFPLIDFLSNNELYEETQLIAAKLELLKPTNMTDFAVEIYQTLHDKKTKIPQEFEERRTAILDSLSFAKSECRPMLELIADEEKIMQLQSENLLNASYLDQHEGVRDDIMLFVCFFFCFMFYVFMLRLLQVY